MHIAASTFGQGAEQEFISQPVLSFLFQFQENLFFLLNGIKQYEKSPTTSANI